MTIWHFQGEALCDSCGSELWEKIKAEYKENEADINPVMRYDSELFPVPFEDENASDCPDHCASRERCQEYIPLDDGSKIGSLLTDTLTDDGFAYVIASHRSNPTLVSGLWMAQFNISPVVSDFDVDLIRQEIEGMMIGAVNPNGTIVIMIGDERVTFNLRDHTDGINRGFDGQAVPVDCFIGSIRETEDAKMGWNVSE